MFLIIGETTFMIRCDEPGSEGCEVPPGRYKAKRVEKDKGNFIVIRLKNGMEASLLEDEIQRLPRIRLTE